MSTQIPTDFFSVCCNIRRAGKLRNKIFQAHFALQSRSRKWRGFSGTLWVRHGADRLFLRPPWGRTDFFWSAMGADRLSWGGPQKTLASAAPSHRESTRALDPSPPTSLPQGARGEGFTRIRVASAVLPPLGRQTLRPDFFWVDPKKGALF
jgi:hypothetical protein